MTSTGEFYDDNKIRETIVRRIATNFLDIIIIAHFQREPFSGYDVTQFVHKQLDILLSLGTVYSTLYAMEREKLLESQDTPNKKTFKVTEKAVHMAKVAMSFEEMDAFFARVIKK